ncbi:MAG: tRNA methyltransferase, partial [Candidatus Woesearchaeota archaeon]
MNRFLARYQELGETFSPENVAVKQCLRVNTLKCASSKLLSLLKAKKVSMQAVNFLDNAFYYKSPFSLGAAPEYLQGFYYLQEAASQLPAVSLNPLPGELVLDMAAAPGSKTTQMAALMKNSGKIIALDSSMARLNS